MAKTTIFTAKEDIKKTVITTQTKDGTHGTWDGRDTTEKAKAKSKEASSLTRKQKRQARREARRKAEPKPDRLAGELRQELEPHSKSKRLNIDQFRYQFDQGARPNRYTVDFYCPALGLNLEGVRCITASLPGRQLETADWSEYGPTRKMPYMLGMDGQEVSFTFVCDSSFADRYIIEAWQSAIFMAEMQHSNAQNNYEQHKAVYQASADTVATLKAKGITNPLMDRSIAHHKKQVDEMKPSYANATASEGSSINPQFAYYNEYVGEIVVKQITRSDKKSLQYRIHEAYPVSFAPMELSAEAGDQLMRFETTFAFRTWESEYSNPNPVSGINKGRRWLDVWASVTNLRKGGNSANNSLQRFNDRLATLGGLFG